MVAVRPLCSCRALREHHRDQGEAERGGVRKHVSRVRQQRQGVGCETADDLCKHVRGGQSKRQREPSAIAARLFGRGVVMMLVPHLRASLTTMPDPGRRRPLRCSRSPLAVVEIHASSGADSRALARRIQMSDKKIFDYPGDDADVHWDGRLCIHIGECGRADNELFVGGRQPWCQPDRVSADDVAEVVARCPTGALTYSRKDGGGKETAQAENVVSVMYNGPLYLRGDLEVDGAADDMKGVQFRAALCRCGRSKNKPFCDNSHEAAGFTDRGSIGERWAPPPTRLPAARRGPERGPRFAVAGSRRTSRFATAPTRLRASKPSETRGAA